jgi:threonine dehydrogenase-like Zn-dependent dehydrogenase
LKSTVAEAPQIDLAPLVINEIQVVGSRCGPFAPALEAMLAGSVEVTPLIAARFDLPDAREALERAAARGIQKVLIDCS